VRRSEENSQLVQLGNSLKIILRDLVSRVITKVLKESSFDDVCLLPLVLSLVLLLPSA
jgi:hypothetical protein